MAKLGQVAVPTFERALVGRKEAEELLGNNTHNRNTRERLTNVYAADMLKGNWAETGEAIKISNEGLILDGQHRLAAIVQAATSGAREGSTALAANPNLEVVMWIGRGFAPESQESMDTGALRRLSDVLSLRHPPERNTTNLAAILRIVYAWENKNRRNIARGGGASNATLLHFFDTDPEKFRFLAATTSAESKKSGLAPSVLGLARYLFEEIGPEDAEFFFERLADGQNMVKGDPIYELREALKRHENQRGHRVVAYNLALTIKAWNAYRQNERIGVLTFKMGGAKPEAFPEPV